MKHSFKRHFIRSIVAVQGSALKGIAAGSLLLGLQCTAAFADGPPKLDVTPTCKAAAQFALAGGRDKEGCLDDEHSAENTLGENWSKYNAADKIQCVGIVTTGGSASYVELLSCLEIMLYANDFRDDSVPRSDQPAPSARRRNR